MLLKSLKLTITTVLFAGSTAVLAVPFNSFDPRSMAMGGAGVAVGDAAMAPFFNPALLSVTKASDDFSMDIPVVGVRVYDPSNFVSSLDNFQKGKYVDNLQTAINNFNTAQTGSSVTNVTSDISALSAQLATLSDKPIQAEAGAGLVVGIPSKKYGGAFYADGWAAAGGDIKYRDATLLNNFITAANAVNTTISDPAGCNGTINSSTACINALNTLSANPAITSFFTVNTTGATPTVTSTFNTNTQLQSSVEIRGATMAEVGLALSREFTISGQSVAIGITPKMVNTTLFDYVADVNSAKQSNATGSDFTAKYSDMNFDLGLAKDYGNGWRSGFVVKNIISHTYDFKRVPNGTFGTGATPVPTGATITLNPQARIGVSHMNSWSTVALDVDLTRNNPAGLEQKSQFVALGGELDAWGWAQLRAGYRLDMVNSANNIASVGLGLAPFTVFHLDLAVAKSSNQVGASMQFGFQF